MIFQAHPKCKKRQGEHGQTTRRCCPTAGRSCGWVERTTRLKSGEHPRPTRFERCEQACRHSAAQTRARQNRRGQDVALRYTHRAARSGPSFESVAGRRDFDAFGEVRNRPASGCVEPWDTLFMWTIERMPGCLRPLYFADRAGRRPGKSCTALLSVTKAQALRLAVASALAHFVTSHQ